MKTGKVQRFFQSTVAAAMVGVITLVCMPAKAAHEHMYAVQYGGLTLFDFYSDAPQNVLNAYAITGLQFGESIQSIDYWNGMIYGLGSSSRLYTLDPNTGAATQVGSGQFSTILNGFTFGSDNGPAGFQVVSGNGQNLLISRTTGAVLSVGPALHYATGDPLFGVAARVDALAYDDATGIWYAGDTLANTMATLNPATGVLNTIGPDGIDAARYNGLDISPFTGIMYMDTPAASSDPQANLYIVSKATGFFTLVGQIGQPGDDILVQGLTVVPEPGTAALVAMGAFGLLLAHRRQR